MPASLVTAWAQRLLAAELQRGQRNPAPLQQALEARPSPLPATAALSRARCGFGGQATEVVALSYPADAEGALRCRCVGCGDTLCHCRVGWVSFLSQIPRVTRRG